MQERRSFPSVLHHCWGRLLIGIAGSVGLLCAENGAALFRTNCAFCHGADGGGGRGPSLKGQLVHGNSLETIKGIIKNGVPGTQMPAYTDLDEQELQALAVHARSFAEGSAQRQALHGDPVAGRVVYRARGCANCHQIGTEGSVYGPNLSRIGGARSLEYLKESIVAPSVDIPDDYRGVTAVTKDGKRITGVRINEDTFTVQLRTPAQSFRMFPKSELKEVIHEKQSLMPAYQTVAPLDLENLLAYLQSLRGEAAGDARRVAAPKGIQ